MKNKLLYGLVMVAAISFTSCNDDEKPETLPTVTTSATIATTTTTATVSGEITDDGNAEITEAGFVYSSLVAEPTTADNKETVTDFDAFSAELTGLNSGTIYNVRAYAINKKGTAYGEKRTFETGNLAPTAANVQITGTLEVAKTVTATFTYADAEGNAQGASLYQWYMADDGAGAGETAIDGATGSTFVIADAQNGKFLKVKVTPVAQTGTLTGEPIFSAYTIAVGAETVTFLYNNVSVTYGTIIGPSGKKWLDRNLGASRMATAINDFEAFGHLFQWGRAADGHQLITRTGATNATTSAVNGVTTVTSDDDTPDTPEFVTDAVNRDWRTTQNDNLWQGVSGINNPCPSGWRLATRAEFEAEFNAGMDTPDKAFTLLKLTRSGSRSSTSGNFSSTGTVGIYWSSTPYSDEVERRAFMITVGSTTVSVGDGVSNPRGTGLPCRCIKN